MTSRARERLMLLALLALGCATFLTGITWGLPSRQSDAFLFGSLDNAWSGAQIVSAGGAWKPDLRRASDADVDPIAARNQPVWLNQTPRQQAEIIRRYRLFSYQPDEMVTFLALAGMPAAKYDPRMYQYGGLWFYPIGSLLRVAGAAGLVELRPDMTVYLDHPEGFARFYIVARLYSAGWGLLGIYLLFHLAKRFSSSLATPAIAGACFALMPVIINGAHEAKPHLAGAVLTLAAVLAATKYAETGARKWWPLTGVLCGASAGMVLSGAISFVVIPVMVLLRREAWPQRAKKALVSALIGVATYCVTNPYVPINLVRNPQLVRENLTALSHAKAISGTSSDAPALTSARRLIYSGASVILTNVGLIGIVVLLFHRKWWHEHPSARAPAILLGLPAFIVAAQFLKLAGGKTGEFARFAILPDLALALAALAMVSMLDWGRAFRAAWYVVLVALTAYQGLPAVAGFTEDSWARETTSSRVAAARELQTWYDRGARTLAVRADPAPYSLPPTDLTRWKLILQPDDAPTAGLPDLIVGPTDAPVGNSSNSGYRRFVVTGRWPWLTTRLSWADKPIEILVRADLAQTPAH